MKDINEGCLFVTKKSAKHFRHIYEIQTADWMVFTDYKLTVVLVNRWLHNPK